MKWTDEEHNFLVELVKSRGTRWKLLAELMSERFGKEFTFNQVRSHYRMNPDSQVLPAYNETTEILADGSHKSDKLLRMSAAELKDTEFLLTSHGYDPSKWEIVNAKSSIWNQHNKEDGTITLYSSKITVKPALTGMDWGKLITTVESAPSVFVKPKYTPGEERYLNIPLYDMHFGISDYNHYLPTQAKVLNVLKKPYKEILFLIGSDLFHHNDHRNRTASGREIEHADMSLAWEDAAKFYEPILHEALKNSGKVTGIFIKGNHSESLEWAFTKYLQARFPQITFNTDFRERKVHMLGDIMIAATHGDKARKRLNENFATEFPLEWSRATTRELFIGHLHTEEVIDKGGILQRALSTRNKVDSYHDDYGYTASHKRFQLFEYSKNEIEHIHFV
ncbi:SANT/Myb-like DNA-binding domain-containing protein [Planomicrobium okeanokoites]|uniref:SANT/Myb-like DNA-binding domain-containing protein n=1 Tax=Planomicrobium okeanokoites TaxID=244 RepID=A0ABV7KTE1_PLAOK|nr:SANT/Myb-like DNA-binding domain-containing protein [Planomicrobium okeanokoites]TAA71606.1 hypothetical protein D2910_04830 [Planomicrobium okeanokoites]